MILLGHAHSFTPEAIAAIKRRRMSDVICDNTLIRSIGSNAFMKDSTKMECRNSEHREELDLEAINLLIPSGKYFIYG